VEAGIDLPCAEHSDLSRKASVQACDQRFRRNCGRQVEVGNLAGRMDARVGPTRPDELTRKTPRHGLERSLELALDGPSSRLTLPAVERGAQIRNTQLYSVHHRGYPRMGGFEVKVVRRATLGAVLLIPALAVSATISTDEVRYFPGDYFDGKMKSQLQRQAMERWPGPSGLLERWDSDRLEEEQRIALLIGAAAHHEPRLLRMYRQAVLSDSPRLRQAAAYGYHELLADRLPNVQAGIDRESAERLAVEIRTVRWTLYRQPLVAMWLQAALATEDLQLPGFLGVAPERAAADCFQAIDRVMQPEDLGLLVDTYRVSQRRENRISLLRLIEGLTLSRFVVIPRGDRAPWGDEVYDRALAELDARLERWTDSRCEISYRGAVSDNLARMGARGVDPLHPESCHVWGLILLEGDPGWWAVAARRLYECGGPWAELSVLQAASDRNAQDRDMLVRWHKLRSSRR
jgi:hypothetical protein